MSRTLRWWRKGRTNIFRYERIWGDGLPVYKQPNPHGDRHEYKLIRVKIHRALRRNNKIRLQKGFEIEPEQKTNGWMTH